MRRQIVIITTRAALIAMRMKSRSAKTAAALGGRGEACEEWCATNRPVPEPVHSLAVKEQEVDFFAEVRNNEVPRLAHVP